MEHQESNHLEQGNPSGHPTGNKSLRRQPHVNFPGFLKSNLNQHRAIFNLLIRLQWGSDWRLEQEISVWCSGVSSRLCFNILSRHQNSPHLFAPDRLMQLNKRYCSNLK